MSKSKQIQDYLNNVEVLSDIKKKVKTSLLKTDRQKNTVLKYFEDHRSIDSLSLLEIRVLDNVSVTLNQKLLGGIVYRVTGDMKALPLLDKIDMCNGVSGYTVTLGKDVHLGTQREVDALLQNLRQKIVGYMDKKNRDFEDYSVHRNRDDTEYEDVVGLGQKNCSITLERLKGSELKLMLIIRTYHEPSNRALLQSMNSNSTFHSVFRSSQYRDAVAASENNRNALAWLVSKRLGLECEETPSEYVSGYSVPMCRPTINNSFNMIQEQSHTVEKMYLFYCNCFNTMKEPRILFGISRNVGYVILNATGEKWQNDPFYNALPLGTRRTISTQNLVKLPGIKSRNRSESGNDTISWGGIYPHNTKSFDDSYDVDSAKDKENILNTLAMYGYNPSFKTKILIFIAAYISSNDPEEMSLDEILNWRNPKDDTVLIPARTLGQAALKRVYEKQMNNRSDDVCTYFLGDVRNENGHFYKIHTDAFNDSKRAEIPPNAVTYRQRV